MKIIEELNNALKEKGISQSEAARQAGIDQKTANLILSGKTKKPAYEDIEKLKEVLGAKPVRRVPVLGSVPAGFPKPTMPVVAEEVTEWVYRSDLPDDAFALRVEGDSMPPLETGDYVAFVANGDYHDKDRVVVANEYGDPIVKRLRIRPDGCQMLVSDNPKYEPIQPNENYRIIGKVIKAWRELI